MPENKVIYGLKNAHYSLITEGEDGLTHTYGAPVALLGSVEITLEPKGEQSDFYADDTLFHTTVSNQGYTTTLSIANISQAFKTDVLGETVEATDMVLTENANAKPKKIAFMFEFDGDQKAVRYCLYNCSGCKTNNHISNKNRNSRTYTTGINFSCSTKTIRWNCETLHNYRYAYRGL